jgi:GAF domain-containing protein
MTKLDDRIVDLEQKNAELRRQLDEALAQQGAIAEVLNVIARPAADLSVVLQTVVTTAHRLCRADYAVLFRKDGDLYRWAAFGHTVAAGSDELERNAVIRPGTGTLIGRAVLEGRAVQIEDAWTDPLYEPKEDQRKGGIRTMLGVPLMREGEAIGAMGLARGRIEPFTDRQIALVENFAAQAVIAIGNARLLTETREALDQQTATAEVLQVINASPGDLAPVFDAMLEKAIRLCESDFGILWKFGDGQAAAVALHRVPAAYADLVREPFRPSPESGPARMMRGDATFVVPDLRELAPYQAGDSLVRAIVDLAGARSVVITPLRKDGATIGAITIYRQEVRPFVEKQIALLENFAAQAVIAIENARLLTETREALDQQTATAEVLQVINASPGDLAPVFEALLDKAMRLCGAAYGHVMTFDGEYFESVAVHGKPELVGKLRQLGRIRSQPESLGGRLALGQRVVHIPDAVDDDAYRSGSAPRLAVVEAGVRSLLGVGLRKDGALLGIIAVYREEQRPFSDREISLLENFAAQAVIAMENARLINETREALDQQTATAEVLQVINSSPGDLTPVFEAMLEKAHRLCGSAQGTLELYDGTQFHAVATRGVPEQLVERLRRGLPGSDNPMGRPLLAGEPFFQVTDITEIDDPVARLAVGEGRHTILSVPLRKGTTLLGMIVAERLEVRPFSEKEIALLQNFAAQAVIAIENARLLTETREALDQQTATAEVLQVINSSPGDLAPVFDAMLEKALNLCDAACGHLRIYDGERLVPTAIRGVPKLAEALREASGAGPASAVSPSGRVLAGEDMVHIIDLKEVYQQGHDGLKALVEIGGARSVLAVALRKEGVLLGSFTLYRQEVRPFTDKQIALLQNFAAQAVIAVENARLLGELRQRTEEIAGWNRELEARVAAQVDELGRVEHLKRFLPPQLAELVVAQGDGSILKSHRREIVVVFCDVRGYTAFAETAEPEEVIEFLGEYHAVLGPLITRFEGTLSHFFGDGLMVIFNDPVPCPDPAERAVKMALAMRDAAGDLVAVWRRRGYTLGFGAGIAQGYATLGQIGFADRMDYTAIGTVCNLAARLCGEAQDGQILVARRIATAVEGSVVLKEVGARALKGLTQPVVAFDIVEDAALATPTES